MDAEEHHRLAADAFGQLRAKPKAAAEVEEARQALDGALQQVAPDDFSQKRAYERNADKDRPLADKTHFRILATLEQLRGQ